MPRWARTSSTRSSAIPCRSTYILKALRRSPLGLDLYLWLTCRTFSLKRPLRLSWARLYRQFGLDPAMAGDKRTVDYFRTDCLRELIKIRNVPGRI